MGFFSKLIGKDDFDKSKAEAFIDLGYEYIEHGEIGKGIEMYQNALKLYISLGDKENMAGTYARIAYQYEYAYDDQGMAIKLYQQALQILKDLDDKESMSGIFHALGDAYKAHGNTVDAKRHYQKAFELYNLTCEPRYADVVKKELDALTS
jgi:tetratricopeptide (TPR) repeat protein